MEVSARQRVIRFFDSKWFFGLIILLFAAEALWLAVVNRYPMAFDESYHFGLIQFFSHRLSPIVTSQPSTTYALGSIAHNPSFLYHYLLSFPYRLVAHFTTNLKIQVISLRVINIAFAITSLYVIRKTLRLIGLKASVASLVVFIFAFTPVFTALSAQINYDNLLILVTSLTVYLLLSLIKTFQRERQLNVNTALKLLCLCLLASEVKYAFLPIFIGVFGCLIWLLVRVYRTSKAKLWSQLKTGFSELSKSRKIAFAAIGLIGLGLFTTTYGVNLVRYHNPVPQCNQVLSVQDCEHYYSWDRNYQLAIHKTSGPKLSTISYSYLWVKTATYQLYAEIIPTGGMVPIARDFLIILGAFASVALFCTLTQLRRIFREYKTLVPLAVVAVCYIFFLWARNYHDYLQLGQPVAIQGRYLLPVLVYAYVVLSLGVIFVLQGRKLFQSALKPLAVGLLVGTFVYFGGYSSYATHVSPAFGWVAAKPHVAKASQTAPDDSTVALRLHAKLV